MEQVGKFARNRFRVSGFEFQVSEACLFLLVGFGIMGLWCLICCII